MIDRAYVAAHGALQSLAERKSLRRRRPLSDAERRRERGAWFGSIHKTLSHILWADHIWMSRFTDLPKPPAGIPESVSLYPDWDESEGRARGLRPDHSRLGRHGRSTPGLPPIRPIIPARPSANGRGRAGFWSPICSITRPIIAARSIPC